MNLQVDDHGRIGFIIPDDFKVNVLQRKPKTIEEDESDFVTFWLAKSFNEWFKRNFPKSTNDEQKRFAKLLRFTFFEYQRTDKAQTSETMSLLEHSWTRSLFDDNFILCIGQLIYDHTIPTEKSQYTLFAKFYGFMNRRIHENDNFIRIKTNKTAMNPLSAQSMINGFRIDQLPFDVVLIPDYHSTLDKEIVMNWMNNPLPKPILFEEMSISESSSITMDDDVPMVDIEEAENRNNTAPSTQQQVVKPPNIYLFKGNKTKFSDIRDFFFNECATVNFNNCVIEHVYMYQRIYTEILERAHRGTKKMIIPETWECDDQIDERMSKDTYIIFKRIWSHPIDSVLLHEFIVDHYSHLPNIQHERMILHFLSTVFCSDMTMLYWFTMAENCMLKYRLQFHTMEELMELIKLNELKTTLQFKTKNEIILFITEYNKRALFSTLIKLHDKIQVQKPKLLPVAGSLAELTFQCLEMFDIVVIANS